MDGHKITDLRSRRDHLIMDRSGGRTYSRSHEQLEIVHGWQIIDPQQTRIVDERWALIQTAGFTSRLHP